MGSPSVMDAWPTSRGEALHTSTFLGHPLACAAALAALDRYVPERVLERMTYHHPLFTPAAVAAQSRHREVNGVLGTYYCGAYWRFGFHEDGVASALAALAHFDEDMHAQRPISRAG